MRLPFLPLLLFVLVMSGGDSEATRAEELGPGREAALRQSWEGVYAEYVRSKKEAVDLEILRGDLGAVADELESARMDSLACTALNCLQELHTRNWELDEARGVLDRALGLARRSEFRAHEANLLMSMAVTRAIDGEFELAISLMGDVIPIAQELGEIALEGRCWFNTCVCYAKLGRVPEALATNARAIEIAHITGESSSLASGYSMAAELQSWADRQEEALAMADSAIAVARREGWALQHSAALTVKTIALQELERWDEALAAAEEAIQLRRAAGLAVYLPPVQLAKGLVLLSLGRFEDCVALMDEIRPSLEAQDDDTFLLARLVYHSQALIGLERWEEAELALNELMHRFEEKRADYAENESQAGAYRTGGEAYAALARCRLRRGEIEDAWRIVERGRASNLRARLGVGFAENELPLETLQTVLAQNDAVLVQYTDPGSNPLTAFVLDGHQIRAFELGWLAPLTRDARVALDAMAAGLDDDQCEQPLRRLSEGLLSELASALPANAQRVILVPPTPLAGFPMETLPIQDGETSVPFGERFAISYLPSASLLSHLLGDGGQTPEDLPDRPTIVAFADPELLANAAEPELAGSQLRELQSTPLPFARQEVEILDRGHARIHTGADARKGLVLRDPQASTASILHFATHAIALQRAPERSSLLLAGEDGRLEAAEIEQLDLAADLVTLSGCQTSGGFVYMGEGTFGLTRSFLVAGARSVVSSLWNVEDGATAHFMEEFYQGLLHGLPRDESLRRARRRLREEGYPYRDRAAFVLTGLGHEPVLALANAQKARPSPVLYLAPILGLMLVLLDWARRRRGRPRA